MVLALWYAKSNFQVHYLICLSSTKLLRKVLSPTRIVKICIVLKSSPVLDMITKHSSPQKIKKSKQFRKLNHLHLIVFSWWFDEAAMNNKITFLSCTFSKFLLTLWTMSEILFSFKALWSIFKLSLMFSAQRQTCSSQYSSFWNSRILQG